jgi:hypothetical protein
MAFLGASAYLGALLQAVLLRREMIAGMEALGAVTAILGLGAMVLSTGAIREGSWLLAALAAVAIGFLVSISADAWSRRRDEVPGERWQG